MAYWWYNRTSRVCKMWETKYLNHWIKQKRIIKEVQNIGYIYKNNFLHTVWIADSQVIIVDYEEDAT